jgi:hypothetical protein
VNLKVDTKASCDLKNCSESRLHTGENQPITAKESWNRNADVSFGTIFRISKCFHKAAYKKKHPSGKSVSLRKAILFFKTTSLSTETNSELNFFPFLYLPGALFLLEINI